MLLPPRFKTISPNLVFTSKVNPKLNTIAYRLVGHSTWYYPWTASQGRMKTALIAGEAVDVPHQDRWHLPFLSSLLSQRREAHNMALEEEKERLTELIDSLAAN